MAFGSEFEFDSNLLAVELAAVQGLFEDLGPVFVAASQGELVVDEHNQLVTGESFQDLNAKITNRTADVYVQQVNVPEPEPIPVY